MNVRSPRLRRACAVLFVAAGAAASACIPVEPDPSPYGGLQIVLVPTKASRSGFETTDGWTVTLTQVFASYGPDTGAFGGAFDDDGTFDPSRPRACASGTYETPIRRNLVDGPYATLYRRVREGTCTPGLRPTFAYADDGADDGAEGALSSPSTFFVAGEARSGDGRVVRFEIPFLDPPGVHVCGSPPTRLSIVAREATTYELTFAAEALFESPRVGGGPGPRFGDVAALDADGDGVVDASEVRRSLAFDTPPRAARALRGPDGDVCPLVPYGTDYAR